MIDKNLKTSWTPSATRVSDSLLAKFAKDIPYKNYQELHEWSVENLPQFWNMVWDFCKVTGDKGDKILVNPESIEHAQFFPNATLNFAENLLRNQSDDLAITFVSENKSKRHITYKELYLTVSKIADHFKDWGVTKGDRVAGYLPNIPEAAAAMLATAAQGAIWTACSPDFGVQGVIDRFSQIEPKILIIADGYYYNGKEFSCLDRLPAILEHLPTVERVIVVSYLGLKHDYARWDQLITSSHATEIMFTRICFNDPLYILYSSGTTGVPKCIVHGVGGTLLKHLAEHQLQCDIKPNNTVFYFTTCSWMMWHWLVSSLASNAHIVLFDGAPTFSTPTLLWDIAEELKINFFGTSAKYLSNLHKLGVNLIKTHNLTALKTIGSTGSPLLPETFEYIWSNIKQDVQISSLSGGTDIISCFVIGNPLSTVYRGEIQGPSLGLAVDVFDEQGNSLKIEAGELVCIKPFPCKPIGFFKDESGQKYHQAYYAKFNNIWHHGDFCEWTKNHGLIIHGRSDATLNPGGVRIGTAEIYRQLENIDEVNECLAVGQKWHDDERVILFVVLKANYVLTDNLINHIRQNIRKNTTPRHVPAKIIAVKDLPRTKNNKLAEIAVRDVIHGKEIRNMEALLNPECLEEFRQIISKL